jgi:2-methylisocitrate lyase-like PEP mutase family enzyme
LPRPYPATVLSSFTGAIAAGTCIHRFLEEVGSIAFPGVFDTLSAELAHRAAFSMAFVSGYSDSATYGHR